MLKKLVNKMKTKAFLATGAGTAVVASALPGVSSANAITFGTNTLDVSASDVVSTGFNFANMFGEYTTLILGVMIAPVVVGFIVWLWRKLPKFGGGRA